MRFLPLFLTTLFIAAPSLASQKSIMVNSHFQYLKAKKPLNYRQMMLQAGRELSKVTIVLSGVTFKGGHLIRLAKKAPREPFLRVVREDFKRPIDLYDFLLFLDDVIYAYKKNKTRYLWVSPGRARNIGIMIHPDDVFYQNRPRKYPHGHKTLAIDRPKSPPDLTPAKDNDPLGPNWISRFKNPATRLKKLRALKKGSSKVGGLAQRVNSLISQLERQKSHVTLSSTVRSKKRGYLMWGAYRLKNLRTAEAVGYAVEDLNKINKSWSLNVPIIWRHPKGWRATVEAARQMADAYNVVYATRSGAKNSRHYEGDAFDLTAVGLPRRLVLRGASGVKKTFYLSSESEPRDLSLTPKLIDWVERHFYLKKLKSDYPHWDDAAK